MTWVNEKNQSLFLRDPNLIFTAKISLGPEEGWAWRCLCVCVCVWCEPSLSRSYELTVPTLQWLPSPFHNHKIRFIWLHLHSSHPPQPRTLVLTVLLPRAIFHRHQHNQVSLLRCLLINEAVPGFLIKDKLLSLHPFTLLYFSSAQHTCHHIRAYVYLLFVSTTKNQAPWGERLCYFILLSAEPSAPRMLHGNNIGVLVIQLSPSLQPRVL